jgi:hypothetical protein
MSLVVKPLSWSNSKTPILPVRVSPESRYPATAIALFAGDTANLKE